MSNELDLDRMFSGGGPAAKFTDIGDTHTGRIVSLELRQATDFDTGEPKTWPNGDPVPELLIGLQAGDQDPVTVYCRGQLFAAVRKAVQEAGVKKPEVGGELAIEYIGDDEPKKRGYRGAKRYRAAYDAPSAKALADAFAEPPQEAPAPF